MTTAHYTTSWNLAPLQKSEKEYLKDRNAITKQVLEFVKNYKTDSFDITNPDKLAEALHDYEEIYHTLGTSGDEGYYYSLKNSLDQSDNGTTAKLQSIKNIGKANQNMLLFFELRLAQIDSINQKKLISAKKLSPYKHFLEKIFFAAQYNLSEPEERIMNLRNTAARSNWIKMTSTILSKDQESTLNDQKKNKPLTYIEILPLFSNPDKEIRDSAYKAINRLFNRHIDMAEHEINSLLGDIRIVDEIRGLDRPDKLMHVSDDIDSEVIDAMVSCVKNSFPTSKEFYALKAQLLHQKSLAYYERFIPIDNKELTYSFSDAINIVRKAFSKLDTDFVDIFDTFVQNGHIDAFPAQGKKGGAFCSHNLMSQPTYILLNFAGKLDDVLTLAHEVGHGIHNELMRSSQNSLNFDTPLATAEIASTFFEGYVLETILETISDEETKLSLLVKMLDDDVNTIIRQVSADLFQRELHTTFREKGYLGKEEIGKLFSTHMAAYMGTSIKQTRGSENWWIYWSHLRVPFYNYQYAFGFLIAKYFLRLVKKDKSNIHAFKEFLSAGASESPQKIFLKSGIDIRKKEFWEEGIKETQSKLDEMKTLAQKLKRI